jgi:carbamoyl-phosphate synthase large subunit
MSTVLITSLGSTTAISAAKALRKTGKHRIIGTDINPFDEIPGTLFCDKLYQVGYFHQKKYIRELLDICMQEKVEFILPIVDQEVEKIAEHEKMFRQFGIIPCVSSYQTVKTCNDKYLTWHFLQAMEIDTPRVFLPKESKVFSKMFPLFLKPRYGVSSRNCYQVRNMTEYQVLSKRIEEPIIQQMMNGEQYVIDIMNDLNAKNITAVIRHEISAKSGLGVKAVTVHNERIRRYVVKIAETIGIKGPANVEVFKKGSTISLIEVNPRLSAGSILSATAGVNIAQLTLDVFSQRKMRKKTYTYLDGVYMTRYWEEAYFKDKKLLKLHS